MAHHIERYNDKKGEKMLRAKTAHFDFGAVTKKEIDALIREMKQIMREANGIGLAGNQIGIEKSVFVAEIPSSGGGTKFYAVFNPKLEKVGEETSIMEEGCLSVPGLYGDVRRAEKVTLAFEDKSGKPQKIKAFGLLARVFQHEMDHLNGKLILDRAKLKKESSHGE